MVGAFAALFLIASVALWGSFRRPAFRMPIIGMQASKASAERSAKLLIAAAGLSALAGFLTLVAYFSA